MPKAEDTSRGCNYTVTHLLKWSRTHTHTQTNITIWIHAHINNIFCLNSLGVDEGQRRKDCDRISREHLTSVTLLFSRGTLRSDRCCFLGCSAPLLTWNVTREKQMQANCNMIKERVTLYELKQAHGKHFFSLSAVAWATQVSIQRKLMFRMCRQTCYHQGERKSQKCSVLIKPKVSLCILRWKVNLFEMLSYKYNLIQFCLVSNSCQLEHSYVWSFNSRLFGHIHSTSNTWHTEGALYIFHVANVASCFHRSCFNDALVI